MKFITSILLALSIGSTLATPIKERGAESRLAVRESNDVLARSVVEREAEPFLGDIGKLIGLVIDTVRKSEKREAEADPFLGDIAKLIGMVIDNVSKRDAEAEAEADPFLGDIAKLIGMVIDKAT